MTDEGVGRQKRAGYITLSPLSIQTIAEQAGFEGLQDNVYRLLSEDVGYRLRELIQLAGVHMKVSRRRRMVAGDVTRALQDSDIQPLFGHASQEPVRMKQVPEAGVWVEEEKDLDLHVLATVAVPDPPPTPVTLHGRCLHSALGQNRPGSTSAERGTSRPVSTSLQRDAVRFLVRALTQPDVTVARAALTEVWNSQQSAPLIPSLLDFVAVTTEKCSDKPGLMVRVMQTARLLLKAACRDSGPPTAAVLARSVLPHALSCVLLSSVAGTNAGARGNMRRLQITAADLVAVALTMMRDTTWQQDVEQALLTKLQETVAQPDSDLTTLSGVVATLAALGSQTLEKAVGPELERVWGRLQKHLSSTSRRHALLREQAVLVVGSLNSGLLPPMRAFSTSILQSGCSPSTEANLYLAGKSTDIPKRCPIASQDTDRSSPSFTYLQDQALFTTLPLAPHGWRLKESRGKTVKLGDPSLDSRSGEQLLQEILSAPPPPAVSRADSPASAATDDYTFPSTEWEGGLRGSGASRKSRHRHLVSGSGARGALGSPEPVFERTKLFLGGDKGFVLRVGVQRKVVGKKRVGDSLEEGAVYRLGKRMHFMGRVKQRSNWRKASRTGNLHLLLF